MRSPLLVLVALFCGCSGQVNVTSNSAASTGSTTGASTSTGSTTTGAGGSTATGAGAGGSIMGSGGAGGADVTTSGTGSGPACPGVINVDIDGNGEGPTMLLTTSCTDDPLATGAYGALGYLGEGGPQALFFQACSDAGDFGAPASLFFWGKLTGPGTTQVGHVELTHFGKAWTPTDDMTLVIDNLGPVGGMIVGTLSFTVAGADGMSIPFSAKIQVCRREDFPPPP